VNTVEKNVFAFFGVLNQLQEELEIEIEALRKDVYLKVSLLFQGLSWRNEPISDLWVPKFSLNLQTPLPWMSNLPMTGSTTTHYLTSCSEQVQVSCSNGPPPPAQLPNHILRGAFLTRPFFFGIFHSGLVSRRDNSQLSPPLFVTYIGKESWLRR
jgi:hypothetical protein